LLLLFSCWPHLLVTPFFLLALADGLMFTIPPGEPTCLMEPMPQGEMFTLIFEVIAGGDMHVEATVRNAGHPLSLQNRVSGFKQTFTAAFQGDAEFCFRSTDSDEREIDMIILHNPKLVGLAEKTDPLTQALEALYTSVNMMHVEQKYLRMRERSHKVVVLDTNDKVVYWSVLEIGVLLGVFFFQVMYLIKFFEVTRGV